MRTRDLPQILLLAAALGTACGSRSGNYDATLQSEGPFAATSFVVALNDTDSTLIAIDPLSTQAPQVFPLPANARHLTLTPDGNSALVVTGDAQSPALVVASLAAGTLGQLQTIALPANPDVVNLSPDGHFALLTYDSTATQTAAGQAIIDPNEAVVVDLTSASATSVALGTDSPAPTGVAFAAPGQGGTQLAAVLFGNGLAVLDLGAPAHVLRVPVQVQGGPAVAPLKALFSGFNQGQGYVYVLAAQSDDVIAVSISTAGGLSGSINFLAGGTGLADIALPPGPPSPSTVLALYTTTQAAVQLDASGIVDLTISTPLTSPATHLVAASSGMLLLWAEGSTQLSLWQPAQAQLASVQLDAAPQALAVSPSGSVAVAAVSASNAELVVLQLGLNALGPTLGASPLLLAANAVAPTFDPGSGQVYFGEEDEPYLSRVDPGTLASEQVTLDAPATGIGLTSGAVIAVQAAAGGVADEDLVESPAGDDSGSLFGQITAVPIASFTRANAEVFSNYLITQEVEFETGS